MTIADAAPEHESGVSQQIDRGPIRTPEEVAAERAASFAEVEARQGEAVLLDARTGEIGGALMELYADKANAELLQPFVDDGQFPEEAATRLCKYEVDQKAEDPAFDVTKQNPRKLAFLLKALGSRDEALETDEEEAKKDEDYTSSWDILSSDPDWQKLDNMEKLLRLTTEEAVPEAERARYQSLLTIHSLAATPEDAAIVTAKINSLNFDAGVPDPVLFVETQILADESLSASYRDTVAKQFNLPNPRVKTGGQVNQTLDARDPGGKPLYTPEHPVNISDNTQAYVKPDGSRAVLVDMGDGRSREIPWERGEADDVIGTKISLVKIWAQNEWGGQTDFFGESIDIENDILSQTDSQKLTKVRNTMNAIFGGTRGFDAVIIQDNEASFIGWFNQYLATKGDAAIGDFDKNTAVTNRVNLGVHPHGNSDQIDFDVLRAAALYAKGEYGMGEPNYYALQKHLHEMFPEKDIPLTGENMGSGLN